MERCYGVLLAAILSVFAMSEEVRASELKDQTNQAVSSFLDSEAAPETPMFPIYAESESMSGERVGDMAVGLIFLVLAFFGGVFLRDTGLPSMPPAVFAAAMMGLLMFTVVNTEFWQMKSVTADGDGLTIERYTSSNSSIRWSEVKTVRLQEGSLFPMVSDDTSLVLVAESGEEFPIPRFLSDSDAIARAVKFMLGQ